MFTSMAASITLGLFGCAILLFAVITPEVLVSFQLLLEIRVLLPQEVRALNSDSMHALANGAGFKLGRPNLCSNLLAFLENHPKVINRFDLIDDIVIIVFFGVAGPNRVSIISRVLFLDDFIGSSKPNSANLRRFLPWLALLLILDTGVRAAPTAIPKGRIPLEWWLLSISSFVIVMATLVSITVADAMDPGRVIGLTARPFLQ